MIARLKLEVSDEERAELMKRARSRTIPSRDRFRVQIVLCRADGLSKAETANKLDFYTHDGNKNVSELVFFQQANGIAAHYEYAPFGAVTATSRSTPVSAIDFRAANPFRFSSEYADDELRLVYYNYRHYNTINGRWCSRDMIEENGGLLLYGWSRNSFGIDYLGLNNPSSFLDGVKDFDTAKKLIETKFPNDKVRCLQEMRRWNKAMGLRQSSIKRIVRITKAKSWCASSIFGFAATCACNITLVIDIILTPSQIGAEPIFIDGKPVEHFDETISEGSALGQR